MLLWKPLSLAAALAVLLSACQPQAPGAASSAPPEDADEDVSVVQEEPPAPPEPQPVLTQGDVDQALDEVMQEYTAAAVSVATIEHGQLSKSGAWGWAVKNEREMTADT